MPANEKEVNMKKTNIGFLMLLLGSLLMAAPSFSVTDLHVDPKGIAGMNVLHIYSKEKVLLQSGRSFYMANINGQNVEYLYTAETSHTFAYITKNGNYAEILITPATTDKYRVLIDLISKEVTRIQVPGYSIGSVLVDKTANRIFYSAQESGYPVSIFVASMDNSSRNFIGYGVLGIHDLSDDGNYLFYKSNTVENVPLEQLVTRGILDADSVKVKRNQRLSAIENGTFKYPNKIISNTYGDILIEFPDLGQLARAYLSPDNQQAIFFGRDPDVKHLFKISLTQNEGHIISNTAIELPLENYYAVASNQYPWSTDGRYLIYYALLENQSGEDFESIKLILYDSLENVSTVIFDTSYPQSGFGAKFISPLKILCPDIDAKTIYEINISN